MIIRTALASVLAVLLAAATGCMGAGMGMPTNGGYNTTNTVNQVPCGPAGSLVPLDPERFDQSMITEVASCQQWFRLAIYNDCVRREQQLRQTYLMVQVAPKVIDRVFGDNGYSNWGYVQMPYSNVQCQAPQVLLPQTQNGQQPQYYQQQPQYHQPQQSYPWWR